MKTYLIYICITLLCQSIESLKHHLTLINDHRALVSVSSFGYLIGGRLDVAVQNLTLIPDPNEEQDGQNPNIGFVLIRSDQARNPYAVRPGQETTGESCILAGPMNQFRFDIMRMSLNPAEKKVSIMCSGYKEFPLLKPKVSSNSYSHENQGHNNKKRAATHLNISAAREYIPEEREVPLLNQRYRICSELQKDLPLTIETSDSSPTKYSFNFSMTVRNDAEEGLYYLTFINCRGHHLKSDFAMQQNTIVRFNLSMQIYETNHLDNYLSAGAIPLPQMYSMLSVMFFLTGCVWINFITRQKDNTLKIHHLMTILVFAKACSLLFHGINYHYIAMDGQPVVTFAYLYYATRSIKGALFFITLALIGSGWTFIKHILSAKDKKIILVVVALQVISHIAEIILDESTEGEASIEFWAELCGLIDLFCCVAILVPITWSIRHLEEASRTDGKAAINLKKLELFKSFYVISTIYIYVTRIMTFVFLSMLTYRYSWLAELFSEAATLIYFIITGYYFQPTNPYLLLSSDNDGGEDILFSVDDQELQFKSYDGPPDQDKSSLLEGNDRQMTRRAVEELV